MTNQLEYFAGQPLNRPIVLPSNMPSLGGQTRTAFQLATRSIEQRMDHLRTFNNVTERDQWFGDINNVDIGAECVVLGANLGGGQVRATTYYTFSMFESPASPGTLYGKWMALDYGPNTFIPDYLGTITLGTGGVDYGSYQRFFNQIHVRHNAVLGSAGFAVVSAQVQVPFNFQQYFTGGANSVVIGARGHAAFFDSSPSTDISGVIRIEAANRFRYLDWNAGGTFVTTGGVTATTPITWAAGDAFNADFIAELDYVTPGVD